MKRAILLFALIGITRLAVTAQAYEDKVQYDKKKQEAIAIEYSYPPEAVQNAIIQKFSKLGYKPKEEKGLFNPDKGFIIFKNAYVTEISPERMDYIFNIVRKSRKEKDETVLYLILYQKDKNALLTLESYSIGKAKSLLNEMLPDIEEANLELQIKDQENSLAKAEKKLKNLQDEKRDLEKKLRENESSQEDTVKDIDNQRQNLELLKGKRRPQIKDKN